MSDFEGVVAQECRKFLGEHKTVHKCAIMMDCTKKKKSLHYNSKIRLSFFNIFLNGKLI